MADRLIKRKTMQGVIFDLDGTLLDSMPLWRTAARNYLRDNYGIYADESLADEVLKLTITEAAELLKTRYGLSADTAAVAAGVNGIMEQGYFHTIAPMPGAEELLKALKARGIPMAIATATDRYLVEAALARLGWTGYFCGISTCTEAGAGKRESAAVYDMAMKSFGGSRKECTVAEDSAHAARTALAAGYRVAGVGADPALISACTVHIPSLVPLDRALGALLG